MITTPKQKAVFDYIKNYNEENGFSPTFEEIAHNFKYKSKGTVFKHIRALKLKGLVHQEWNRVRSLQIADKTEPAATYLHVKGEWKNNMIIWLTSPYDLIAIPPTLIHNDNSYILHVDTDSLNNQFILKGDFVIIQPNRSDLLGGKIVVENSKGKVSLKQFGWNRNPKQVIGQISGVVRKM